MVNPAATGGKISALPWEVSLGLGANPSRSTATWTDAQGEVSRGHISWPGRPVKGRIRKQGAVWTNSMSVERQQGGGYQGDLFDEALLKTLRHGVPGDGGTGAGACAEQQALTALEQQRALTQDLLPCVTH